MIKWKHLKRFEQKPAKSRATDQLICQIVVDLKKSTKGWGLVKIYKRKYVNEGIKAKWKKRIKEEINLKWEIINLGNFKC